ncbi:PEP-CTERM sorting domain-containing protein [Deefgea sp. CFH1-16]|nr:PEP-CTERM sorting domain-containing protein [Deefgea sp. CFH1-16]
MSNLQAKVTGDTLQFISKDGNAIVNNKQIGNGSNISEFNSRLGDIKVQAKQGYQFSTANIVHSGVVDSVGEGGRNAILYSRLWSYAFLNNPIDNWSSAATDKNTVILADNKAENPNNLIKPLTGQLKIVDRSLTSFSDLSSKSNLDIEFYNEIHAWAVQTTTPDSYAHAQLDSFGISMQVAPVPEPETYALMGMGLVGLMAVRRRKNKA